MKIASLEAIPVSVPYRHREVSSIVARDGVSDVLVRLTTDDGLVGWGEACCGADTASVELALRAMDDAAVVVETDPDRGGEVARVEAVAHDLDERVAERERHRGDGGQNVEIGPEHPPPVTAADALANFPAQPPAAHFE